MAAYRGPNDTTWNDISANKTLAKDADAGVVQNVVADAKTITLPAAATGLEFIVRNGGAAPSSAAAGAVSDGSVLITIAPNGTDTIGGGGRTSANTNLTNTKTTSRVGDQVTLLGISGAWTIISIKGTWV